MKIEILEPESGVSLIITFFIMIIILLVVLAMSLLLYSEIKVLRNIGNSVASFYVAESGIEKVLYYDRQVIPEGATNGLCSIPDNCTGDVMVAPNHSIYCNHKIPLSGAHCEPTDCSDCVISFDSTFDGVKTYYYVTATIANNKLDITSRGVFGDASRQIEAFVSQAQ